MCIFMISQKFLRAEYLSITMLIIRTWTVRNVLNLSTLNKFLFDFLENEDFNEKILFFLPDLSLSRKLSVIPLPQLYHQLPDIVYLRV
mgnify:CR=1 FL=1